MEGTNNNNLDLVRQLLETRLDSLNEKIDSNNVHVVELLRLIKEDTGKTNGKVMRLDSDLKSLTSEYHQHLINSANIAHINELKNQIDRLNEENFIIKVWNRYPKQLISIIVVTVLVTIATLGYTMVTVHNTLRNLKAESTQTVK